MTPMEALLSFWADVDTLFGEQDNPLGRNLPPERALKVCRGNLGQIRRWVDKYRTVLHDPTDVERPIYRFECPACDGTNRVLDDADRWRDCRTCVPSVDEEGEW